MPPPEFKNYIVRPHSSFRPSVVWLQVSTNASTASGSSSSQVATAPVSTQFPISEHYSSSDISRFSVQSPSNFVLLASLKSSTLNVPIRSTFQLLHSLPFFLMALPLALSKLNSYQPTIPISARTSPVQPNNHALSTFLLGNLLAKQHMNFQHLGQPFVLYIMISRCILTIASSLNQNCQNSTVILSTTETLCSTSKRT